MSPLVSQAQQGSGHSLFSLRQLSRVGGGLLLGALHAHLGVARFLAACVYSESESLWEKTRSGKRDRERNAG
jgi:hypothetical protein